MANINTLIDRFDQTSRNTALWNQYTGGSATFTYDSTGAQVNFPTSATVDTDGDITSKTSYDLTGNSISLQVLTVPSTSTKADARFALMGGTFDDTNDIVWEYEANGAGTGYIYAQKIVAGVQTNLWSATYSSTTHKYWRIREAGGTTYWETSSDGKSWTSNYSEANPITVTALKINIMGSCWEAETSAGAFKWNNLNITPIGVVQRKAAGNPATSTTIALAFDSGLTVGKNLIAIGTSDGVLSTLTGVSDSKGSTWNLVQSIQGGYGAFKVWVAYNVTAGADTVTLTTGYHDSNLFIYEVTGLSATKAFDKSAWQTQTSITTADSSNTTTTSYANELLLGVSTNVNTSSLVPTVGSGYSNLITTAISYFSGGAEEKIVSATGTYNATFGYAANATVFDTAVFAFADAPQTDQTYDITKTAAYTVPNNVDKTKSAQYTVPTTHDITVSASYQPIQVITITKNADYVVLYFPTVQKNATYMVLTTIDMPTLSGAYNVTWDTSITKSAAYVVNSVYTITKTAQYAVVALGAKNLTAQYTVTSTGNISKQSDYEVSAVPIQKTYVYKVYSSTGTYLTTWSDDVVSDFALREEVNTVGSEIVVQLAREADDFGEGSDVNYANKIQVYCIDKEAVNGLLVFTGKLMSYKANYKEATIDIRVQGYGQELSSIVMQSGSDTTIAHNSKDPSQIIKDVLDAYAGTITYDGSSIDMTGTTVSYTFNTNTVKEGIDKALELAPADWYYYIDQATNKLHFHHLSSTPAHTFAIGKNIGDLSIEKSMEKVINVVYFSGGDIGGGVSLFKKYTNPTSITTYGTRAYTYKDGRVTLTATADLLANKVLQGSPEILVTITIVDSNLNLLGYDLESIKIGQTVKIGSSGIGASSLYDTAQYDSSPYDYDLTNLSSIVFQITSRDYKGDTLTTTLSTTPPDITKRIEDIYRNQKNMENQDNPTAPS